MAYCRGGLTWTVLSNQFSRQEPDCRLLMLVSQWFRQSPQNAVRLMEDPPIGSGSQGKGVAGNVGLCNLSLQ